MSEYALNRLIEERKQWRQFPMYGFAAGPTKLTDGTLNYMIWDCIVPVVRGKPSKCVRYHVQLRFDIHYPASMPKVVLGYAITHPNVKWLGYMTLPKFDPDRPSSSLNIKKILLIVQGMIDKPNIYWFAADLDLFHVNGVMRSLLTSLPSYKLQDVPEQKMNQNVLKIKN